MAKKDLTVDEHNTQVSKDIEALQKQIDELKLTYKSESEKKQASLHECNMIMQGKKLK